MDKEKESKEVKEINRPKEEGIVGKATDFVFELFKEKLSEKYIYHNYIHTEETADAAKKIGKGLGFSKEDLEIVQLAALFHDTGYIYVYQGHEEKSIEIAREFLTENNYPADKIEIVCNAIKATKFKERPQNIIEETLCDADLIHLGNKDYFNKAELLRAEWEIFLNKFYTDLEWAKFQIDFLMVTQFYTHYAQTEFAEQLGNNIQKQREKYKKLKKKQKKNKKKAAEEREKEMLPKKGVETMFRTTYRNHINLSSIGDNKANMMVSINAIILSIVITMLGANLSADNTGFHEHKRLAIPIGILILTCLLSVIFAILSAQPKILSKEVSLQNIANNKANILFFGNFIHLSSKEFEVGMQDIMSNKDLLYGNMIRDIYQLGFVLDKKFRMLKISYSIFMGGIILTVVSFAYAFLKAT